jgi:hypothetical protein
VQQLDVPGMPAPGSWVPPAERDRRPVRLSELMPVGTRGPAGLALETRRANMLESQLWAYRVGMIVQLAQHRRPDRDRPAGTPGAQVPGWAPSCWVLEDYTEFLPDEVALLQRLPR